MKPALVSALVACAGERQRARARRFLEGLSSDELQYIADFFGACILEASAGCERAGAQWAERFAGCERSRRAGLNDQEHKMILVLEYLCRCGASQLPTALRAGGHAG